MATPVQMIRGGLPGAMPVPPQPMDIEENSTLLKVLSCIPLLGVIPSIIQDNSLALKIAYTDDASRLVELIKVKNQYKVANIVREVILVALIATGVALGVLSSGAFAICAPIIGVVVAMNIFKIIQNKDVIQILQYRGVITGLQVE